MRRVHIAVHMPLTDKFGWIFRCTKMYTKEERLKAIAGGRSGNPDRFPKGADLGAGGGGAGDGGIDGDLVMEMVETGISKAEGSIMQVVPSAHKASHKLRHLGSTAGFVLC